MLGIGVFIALDIMKRNGFTLIELIISITIFTIIIVTVYSTFYMGIKAWRRGNTGESIQRVRLGLLKIEKELKKSFFFSEVPFEGTSRDMVFPLSILEEDKNILYVITYSVESDEESGLKQLIREKRVSSETLEDEDEEEERKILISSLKSMYFEYAYEADGLTKDFEWQETWNPDKQDKFPSGVRISLEMDEGDDVYNKVIFIQHGDLGRK